MTLDMMKPSDTSDAARLAKRMRRAVRAASFNIREFAEAAHYIATHGVTVDQLEAFSRAQQKFR